MPLDVHHPILLDTKEPGFIRSRALLHKNHTKKGEREKIRTAFPARLNSTIGLWADPISPEQTAAASDFENDSDQSGIPRSVRTARSSSV